MLQLRPMAVGFHEHTDLGSLDGASTVEAKVKRAKELGRIADCVTDHGTLNALASQWKSCQKHGIQCIHGIEAYVLDPFNPTYKDARGREKKQYAHLTIHFKTKRAYEYFCKLTPIMEARAEIRYGERKPIMTLQELEAISGDIVLGSGCLVGLCQKYLKDGEVHKTIEMYERLRSLAGPGNFYVEVFPHKVTHDWQPAIFGEDGRLVSAGHFKPHDCADDGMPLDYQKKPNQFLLDLARKYKDPVIISEDSHFARPEDKVVQDSKLSNGDQRWKFYNSLHMLSSEEAADSLKDQLKVSDRDIEEFIDNSYKFVELFKDYKFATAKDEWHIPRMEDVYNITTPTTTKNKLRELIKAHGKMPAKDHPKYKVYAERLSKEVAILATNGSCDFLPYFFILEDLCRHCTDEGILYNARGSAGGSLTLYLLGCSITDPIRYNLSFERFMTLGRIKSGSLPDVDMDFSDQHRVFEYLRTKYGDRFQRISIHKPLKIKTSIKDAERQVFGRVRIETEIMCKAMPVIPQGVSDNQWLFGYEDETTGDHVLGFYQLEKPEAKALRNYAVENPSIWKTVLKCLGVQREKSIHACGTLIADRPIQEFMPISVVSGTTCTGFGPKDVEYIGGIKFDFLGVKYLRAIEIVLKLINTSKPEHQKLTWQEFSKDERVFTDILKNIKTRGLFQVNTNSMRPLIRSIGPVNIHQVTDILAICRPAVLDAPSPDGDEGKSAADFYVKCNSGLKSSYLIHSDMEPFVRDTFGLILYQEQQIAIAKHLLNLSDEQAEEFRRATGKKDATLMNTKVNELVAGCLSRGWTKEQSTLLADSYKAASRYSFNRSHALSYALVTYNGAFLKANHPLEFWKGMLTAYGDDQDDIKDLMMECSNMILPVDVLKSEVSDWVIEGRRLRPPLQSLKQVGDKAAEGLLEFLRKDLSEFNQKPVKEKKPRATSNRTKKATTLTVSGLAFNKEGA